MESTTAFRLNSQHLAQRLPPGALLQAAGVCGLQNAAPDAALLSLHARVEGVQPGDVRSALEQREMVMTYSLRSAMYLLPRWDFPVFTLGALPQDEEETGFFIQAATPGLKRVGMGALELVNLAGESLAATLDGRSLSRDDLGRELARWMAARLSVNRLEAWNGQSEYVAGQTLGETLARFALYALALRGSYCLAPGSGRTTLYVRSDQWLGKATSELAPMEAAAELARRFLHAYAPGSVQGLATWAGIHPRQAQRAWETITTERAPVERHEKKGWLLQDDLETYQNPQQPVGARFLPPHDPYLALPDRATIVADRTWQRRVWRAVGNPGVLLLDGFFAGVWRANKKGSRLTIAIEPAAPLSTADRQRVDDEAQMLAALKHCTVTQTTFLSPS